MPERNGETTVFEPRRLGVFGKLVVAFVCVGTLTLVGASIEAWREHRVDEQRKLSTRQLLELSVRKSLRIYWDGRPDPKRDREFALRRIGLLRNVADKDRDAWGNPLVFRCPGPVHTKGWDLYSMGPNGRDDLGQGDDILVGADLAPVESGS